MVKKIPKIPLNTWHCPRKSVLSPSLYRRHYVTKFNWTWTVFPPKDLKPFSVSFFPTIPSWCIVLIRDVNDQIMHNGSQQCHVAATFFNFWLIEEYSNLRKFSNWRQKPAMGYWCCWAKWVLFFLCARTNEKGSRFFDHQCFAFSHRIDFKPQHFRTVKNLLCGQACVMRGQAKIKHRVKLIQQPCSFRRKVGISVSWFLPVNGSLSRFPFHESTKMQNPVCNPQNPKPNFA